MARITHLNNDYLSDFIKLVELVEGFKEGTIDGQILACVLNLSFYCGLRRKEIPNCKIKSTFDVSNSKVRETILFNDVQSDVVIPHEIVPTIKDYLKYLRSLGKKTESDSPLFPAYDSDSGNERSQERKLTRHFKKIFSSDQDNDDSSVYAIKDARKLGIKSLFVSLSQSNSNESSIFPIIAQQYRITPRQAHDVIYDNINPPGNKKNSRDENYIIKEWGYIQNRIDNLKREDENFRQQIDQIIADFLEAYEKSRKGTCKTVRKNSLDCFIEIMLNDLGVIVDHDLMRWREAGGS